MDSNAIVDIQYAILAIRQVLSEDDKYLDGDVLPQMSHSSKLSVIQRELRTIIQTLCYLDHSYRPQLLDLGSQNLIIHRYIASRAKAAVIAVDCALSHLRHHAFWTSPGMTSTSNLIIKGTCISSEAFLTLLHERAMTIGDMSLVGLPNIIDFYIVMHKLGFVLRDLSHALVHKVDTVNGFAAICNGYVGRPPSNIPVIPARDSHPREAQHLPVDKRVSPEAYHESIRTPSCVSSPSSGNGSHDGEVCQFFHEVTPSMSPFTRLPAKKLGQPSAHSLDSKYQFPPQPSAWSKHTALVSSPETPKASTTKPSKQSRRGKHKKRRHRKLPVRNNANTSPETVIPDRVFPKNQSSRFRRNAAITSPLVPSLTDIYSVQPQRSRHRTHTVSRYLSNPPNLATPQIDQDNTNVCTITPPAVSELKNHDLHLDESTASSKHPSLDHASPPALIDAVVPTTFAAKKRRRARRRLTRKLHRRCKAHERGAAARRESGQDEKAIEEARAIIAWQVRTEEQDREARESEMESGYGSCY